MDKLFQYSKIRTDSVNTGFKRYLVNEINWNNRLIAITGARGVGKTTMLLQYIKEKSEWKNDEVIFVNLDDLYFSRNSLVDFTDNFVKMGGKYLILDEVHKYSGWSQEIKSIYDYFNNLKIVFTGSSALDIYKGGADLSRRADLYNMKGLSLREYIQMKYGIQFQVMKLEDIVYKSSDLIPDILKKVKPLKIFREYLKTGYFPFFIEDEP
jgi:predicted AAA+ superfamily ATPase